jgi:seryl-tRNA synthetase
MLTDAQGLIKDFQSARNEMSSELKKDLHQGVESRKSEVKQMLGDFDKAQTEIRKDLKEAHDAWQELISKKKALVKAPPKVKKVEEERVEIPVAEEEVPDWEKKLLTAIRENPNGITLVEVAESLGVAPVVLGRASRSLLEKGEIRKEEKLYFPVTEEES